MLHELLSEYLSDIEIGVSRLQGAYIELYEEEILSDTRVNLRIRIRFPESHLLELNEAVIVKSNKMDHLNYRYHFQDGKNILIFRYDNTPHYPDLDSYPNHKHQYAEVVASKKPAIFSVIEEAKDLVK